MAITAIERALLSNLQGSLIHCEAKAAELTDSKLSSTDQQNLPSASTKGGQVYQRKFLVARRKVAVTDSPAENISRYSSMLISVWSERNNVFY